MRLRLIVSALLFLAILALGAFYFVRHMDDFRLITTLAVGPVLVVVLCKLILVVLQSMPLVWLTEPYGVRLTWLQAFSLSRATMFASLFLPFPGGASVKAVYLKRFHDFKYASFIAAMTISSIIKMMVVSLFAIVVTLPSLPTSAMLLLVAGAFFAGSAGFLLLAHRVPDRWLAFWGRLQKLAVEWRTIRHDRLPLLKVTLINACGLVVSVFTVQAAFGAFEISISLAAAAAISCFLNLVGTMKLIPGDLGIRELVVVGVSGVFGVGVNESLHAAALHRLVETLLTLVLAPGAMVPLSMKSREHE